MGKSSKLKKMRKIAKILPSFEVEEKTGIVSGTDVKGQLIHVKHDELKRRKINHYRQMKKTYNMHGKAGVDAYAESVIIYYKLRNNAKNNS